jgi:hypothetical protein
MFWHPIIIIIIIGCQETIVIIATVDCFLLIVVMSIIMGSEKL